MKSIDVAVEIWADPDFRKFSRVNKSKAVLDIFRAEMEGRPTQFHRFFREHAEEEWDDGESNV